MRRPRRSPWPGLGLWLALAGAAAAGEPLHERIDQIVEQSRAGRLAAPATDGEFLRRASLDLVGMTPTSAEARAFLDEPSPYKRERLIDRLLSAPEYARRMQVVFDVMLMERRPDGQVPSAQWQAYLRESFAGNKPYNQLVREVLSADGTDPADRASAKFYLDRGGDPNVLTRDVGRLFLGRDMTCAQCHDHVLYDDYKQAHYYGLFAFFSRSYLVQTTSGLTTFAEKAEGNVEFTSVFKKKVKNATGPRLIDGPALAEPEIPKGQEYVTPVADKVHSIPRHSRRAQLAPLLASGSVPEFNRNIVNRLWALLMGRGLVHPLDLHHGDNPPSHPELLDLLAGEFVASGFDVKNFLRELALTRTYGRSSEPPPGLSPEDAAPGHLAVAALKPLTPEQLAWSLMQAIGYRPNVKAGVEQQLLVADPRFRDIARLDPRREVLSRELVEQRTYEALAGAVAPFVSQFGGAPGQSQEASDATVHQALFLSNGEPLRGWTAYLAGRLAPIADAPALAEELYLSALTRRPTPDERDEVAKYLADRAKDRPQAVKELCWALLTSAEFRFNH